MSRTAASLAAVLLALALSGCGGDGAEPDAPSSGVPVSLVLDYQPNAVHAGIYSAIAAGDLEEQGIDLTVQEPGQSTDAPKLLRAGRVDLAVMDIHDLAIARDQGVDLVGVGALVQRPLAAVIANRANGISRVSDLAGARIGVTGLPSDDAVVEATLGSAGLDPGDADLVTIGFGSVPALSSGKVDAATAFWNAEGIALRLEGVRTQEFRVDEYGAPSYPELVLVSTRETLEYDRERIEATLAGLRAGQERALHDPDTVLDDLIEAVPALVEADQRAQISALGGALGPPLVLDRKVLEEWADWELRYGLVESRPDVGEAFDFSLVAR